ncbi:MAG: NYN domain-containing protein [Solirubrobacteraceae bacterium]
MATQTSTIETRIPARPDRLPWVSFHWRVLWGLGTVWILDGLEVTMVGSVASRLTEKGSGIAISTSQIGTAAAFYVAGACLGALFFGQLTDRFGRKKLFMVTLGVYIVATVATAFASTALFFFIARFFTGAGIGGEYAAINSAIDELIPARVRGRVDLIINGSYWLGSAAGSAASLVLLSSLFATDLGWRLAFGLGAILGLGVLVLRRSVPESPRWLFIHGRDEEAEAIVDSIERGVRADTGEELAEPEDSMVVNQRTSISLGEIARTAFTKYPKRAWLGLALFVGQAFIYNAFTFDLGTLFTTFFKVSSGAVPVFIIVFALGNFLGPLLLGRLFDTVGRKPMIAGTYLGSAALTVLCGILFAGGSLGKWGFEALIVATFFLASAGASAAYLTVSEIFPMETRALAIAFFYAVGTALGGITGPLLFGKLIGSGDASQVAIGFFVGAAVMAIGGVVEILFGVKAEGAKLEDIAEPLTAEGAEADDEPARLRRERDTRVRERGERHLVRERAGRRRYRPGPGATYYSPGMLGTSVRRADTGVALDGEIAAIERALREGGEMTRRELAARVHARNWGPGRFGARSRRPSPRASPGAPDGSGSGRQAGSVTAMGEWLVDGNNVVGSRPDGWWRDRRGAQRRLVERLERFAAARDAPVTIVFDGRAFDAGGGERVSVTFASRPGRDAADDDIAALVARHPDPASVIVVTSDRELGARVRAAGAQVLGARALLDELDALP